jgi:hypothetical protein
MFEESMALQPLWTPGFAPPESMYNAHLISYIMAILTAIGGFAFNTLLFYLPKLRALALALVRWFLPALFVFTTTAILFACYNFSRLCFTLAALFLLPQFLAFVRLRREKMGSFSVVSSAFWKSLLPLLLCAPIGFSLYIAAHAWYPVHIPNDYYVLPDRVLLPSDDSQDEDQPTVASASRSEIIDCLEVQRRQVRATIAGSVQEGVFTKHLSDFSDIQPIILPEQHDTQIDRDAERLSGQQPKCTLGIASVELNKLYEPMTQTGAWQVQAGRLFYHHSYIYVPAIHFLTYGIGSPIPYLYGVGNTLFHAMLMHATSETLTGYFNTFPIAQLTGVIGITLLVLYITRSVYATLAGMALVLTVFYRIDFEAVIMAPGFNPLRYLGLVVQLASIVALFRGESILRPLSILVALLFSFFWNTEFAMIGLVGQAVALLSLQWRVSLPARAAWLVAAAGLSILAIYVIDMLTHGYLKTMQLVIFGLLPILSTRLFIAFCLVVIVSHAFLALRAASFDAKECAARLALLPVSALLLTKYLYTSSDVHLYFSLILVAPLFIVYFPWSLPKDTPSQQGYWKFFSATALALLCVLMALNYLGNADHFRATRISPFVTNQWTDLGEKFDTVVPAEPIVSRMEAIRQEMKPDDTLIFLSPFDHLMSFYANPQHFCGHFELITNLVTYEQNQEVINCARTAPNVLIVYDDAFDMACPTLWRSKYYSPVACGVRALIKQNASLILKAMGRRAVLDKKVGPLSFYRVQPAKNRPADATPAK